MKLLDFLKLPETKLIQDLNDEQTIEIHRQILQDKPFLKKLYRDYYIEFKKAAENLPKGKLVEIGSGSGFIKEVIPDVLTSDVIKMPNVDMVFSATEMPFPDNSVSAFFLQNVLHHINSPIKFFNEVNRCLILGGKIIMIETFNSLWAKFIFKNFHHEPFDANAAWEIDSGGRLTASNQAQSWIIFVRDREKFEKEFPELKIKKITPHSPFRYIISGGLSIRQLLPSFTYEIIKIFESFLAPLNKQLAMFVTIELEKVKK